jgi:hypothetical protein
MAKFSHTFPGPVVVSNKIIISDACAQSTNTNFEIDQPANSIIDKVFVRVLGGITVASAVDVGFNLGTATDHAGGQIVGAVANGILDGSDALTVSAGNVFSFTVAGGGAATPGVTNGTGALLSDARTLYGRITTGAAAVTGDNQLEISVVYTIFD